MIVKNEAQVIRRCLESVRSLIDAWAIVDTGSTDGTQDIIRDALIGLPGELVERPWKNFGHNRTEALKCASGRGDYIFVIDADEVLHRSQDFQLPHLVADSYDAEIKYGGCSYLRKQLLRADLPWRYEGVLHEYAYCDLARSEAKLAGIWTVPHRDGARARNPKTFRQDALLLEQALLEDPTNTRNTFYLAQSYRDAGDLELALRHYRKRAEMGGWPEEVWYSLYQIGLIEQRLGRPFPEVLQCFLSAFNHLPTRAEPLFRIGVHYQKEQEHQLAYFFLERAMTIGYPSNDRLFVERTIYEQFLPIEYAISCYHVGKHSEAIATNNRLLRPGILPEAVAAQVRANRRHSLRLQEQPSQQGAELPLRIWIPSVGCERDVEATLLSVTTQDLTPREIVLVSARGASLVSGETSHPALRHLEIPAEKPIADVLREAAQKASKIDFIEVVLQPGQMLASKEVLKLVSSKFRDPNVMLLYGEHACAKPQLVPAEPAPDAAAFERFGVASAANSPLFFRTSLLKETRGRMPLAQGLWLGAGFARTRFIDPVLTREGAPRDIGPAIEGREHPEARASAKPTPLASCLMVTRDRLALARRAIHSFAAQTYRERELVIVTDGTDSYRRSIENILEDLNLAQARLITAPDGAALGKLRNLSLEASRGDYICQWDDDDFSHPQRLEKQIEVLERENAGAALLAEHLQYLEAERVVVWIDWSLGGSVVGERALFPGSLLMRRNPSFRYPEEGPYARRGEDSVLLANLYRTVPVSAVRGMGHLYLYQFHGKNAFPREHHYGIAASGVGIQILNEKQTEIRETINLSGIVRPLVVVGREGPAYAVY
jgi:glycosyltransferase involved in cell wall biosynthesis